MTRTDRYADAACAKHIWPDLWHSGHPDDITAAVGICNSCSIRQTCLDDALVEEAGPADQYRWGVRGGLTAAQRSALGAKPGRRWRSPAFPPTGPSTLIANPGDPRHGTQAGRKAHQRVGIPVCDPCRHYRRAAS